MKNRNFQKKDQPKKYKEKHPQTDTYQRPTLIICKICSQKFNLCESFDKTQCNSCYNGLFYYLYINMHLFV